MDKKKHPAKWKAAEMLHNPPGGKELTDKQRKYFAWVAYSKKQMGGEVDPNGYLESNLHNYTDEKTIPGNQITTDGMAFPILANGQPLMPNTGEYVFPGVSEVHEQPMTSHMGQFRNGYYQQGGQIDRNAYYSELLSKSILSGANPLTNEYGRGLVNNNLHPLVDAVNVFNGRPGVNNLQGEARLNAFYDWNSGNPAVENYKRQFKNINYSPAVDSRTYPIVDSTKLTALNKGGKYRYGCR